MKPLRFILAEALDEKQRFGKETGANFDATQQRFKPLYDQESARGNMFIQYSDINKLGINPRTEYNTPLGIYAYPASLFSYNELISGRVPFAGKRAFIIGFKARNLSKVLVIAQDGGVASSSGIKEAQLESIWDALPGSHPHIYHDKKNVSKGAGQQFFYAVYSLSGNNAKTSASLFRKAGIEGVVDEGSGTIHDNEPTQAVFFSLQALQPLFVVPNGVRTERIGKAGIWAHDLDALDALINKIDSLAPYRDEVSKMSQLVRSWIANREGGYKIFPPDFTALMQENGVNLSALQKCMQKARPLTRDRQTREAIENTLKLVTNAQSSRREA